MNKPSKKKDIPAILRFIIQLAFFIFFPSVYSGAFAGVKYVFTQLGVSKSIDLTIFVSMLITVCAYTIVFGRFFCGFACAFGSLGDWVYQIHVWAAKRLKRKPHTIPDKAMKYLAHVKYFVLAAIVIMCYKGVYAGLHGTSPWDVFAQIRGGDPHLAGYEIGAVLLVLVLTGMFFSERFFCRTFCPMGAVFALLPTLPFFTLKRTRENCIKGCSVCTRNCPSDIELPEDGNISICSDCFQCQKCIGKCPRRHIHCGIKKLRGNEAWFTLIRAGLLAMLFIWLGV